MSRKKLPPPAVRSAALLTALLLRPPARLCRSLSVLPPVRTAPIPPVDRTRPGRGAVALSDVPFFASAEGAATEVGPAGGGADGIDIRASDGEPISIDAAAEFMVDAFWLRSPRDLVTSGGGGGGGAPADDVPDPVRSSLIRRQAEDLTDKYGERMGRRLLDSRLLLAVDGDGNTLGLVGIEARLLDAAAQEIWGADRSEAALKGAVASLGPKQRRQYKDSPASELAAELLPPELSLVCVLSNLSVSPGARRRGLGVRLCRAAEGVAGEEWGFDAVYLRVEAENAAARALYEGRLGYELRFSDGAAKGLRVDLGAGDFVEVDADTLTLAKKL